VLRIGKFHKTEKKSIPDSNKKANKSDLPQMLLKRSFPVSVLAWSGSAFMLLSKTMRVLDEPYPLSLVNVQARQLYFDSNRVYPV
jgi:hypothetical protein